MYYGTGTDTVKNRWLMHDNVSVLTGSVSDKDPHNFAGPGSALKKA
jgi:hypothetical protein